MPNKIIKKIPALFLIILILSVIYLVFNRRGCEKLDCITIGNLHDYKLEETYRNEKDKYSALYRKNDVLLRIEILSEISQKEADNLIEEKNIGIKAQFENSRSPYPGEISDEIACNEEFKPVFADMTIIAYLNSRLTYGSCNETDNIYKSLMTWKYCANLRKLYQLEFIYPKKKFREENLEISCLD